MYQIHVYTKTILADTATPVSLYFKFRDIFPDSILLESSDYHGGADNYSFLCLLPIAGFQVSRNQITRTFPDRESETFLSDNIPGSFTSFLNAFKPDNRQFSHLNGFFGYMSYDAAAYYSPVLPAKKSEEPEEIPEIRYHLYQYIIAINHFRNTVTLIENRLDQDPDTLNHLIQMIENRNYSTFPFTTKGEIQANITDREYLELVDEGIRQCHLGNVYQIVLSRRFSQSFHGDEFNVYRQLRAINPSPYLFFFDYTDYKLFGSSPEAHLIVCNGQARICPIAGTFRRTGDDALDRKLAEQLAQDPKENAEHNMLVDLARNDLSRHAERVQVELLKEIHFYSHVLHMVSSVSGELSGNYQPAQLLGDTLPAGTLSGAPKIRAMELIHELEPSNRGFYGGCIGQIGFDKSINHAILIRSFLSRNHHLVYQAGAGIVSGSEKDKELLEVNHKLAALRSAIEQAEKNAEK